MGWLIQGVTKRCRLSWLSNNALVCEPKCGGKGGVAGSPPMSTALHRSPNYGDLTPYLTYGLIPLCLPYDQSCASVHATWLRATPFLFPILKIPERFIPRLSSMNLLQWYVYTRWGSGRDLYGAFPDCGPLTKDSAAKLMLLVSCPAVSCIFDPLHTCSLHVCFLHNCYLHNCSLHTCSPAHLFPSQKLFTAQLFTAWF